MSENNWNHFKIVPQGHNHCQLSIINCQFGEAAKFQFICLLSLADLFLYYRTSVRKCQVEEKGASLKRFLWEKCQKIVRASKTLAIFASPARGGMRRSNGSRGIVSSTAAPSRDNTPQNTRSSGMKKNVTADTSAPPPKASSPRRRRWCPN